MKNIKVFACAIAPIMIVIALLMGGCTEPPKPEPKYTYDLLVHGVSVTKGRVDFTVNISTKHPLLTRDDVAAIKDRLVEMMIADSKGDLLSVGGFTILPADDNTPNIVVPVR